MMPRHFTEEIRCQAADAAAGQGASMMPRHFTEEIRLRDDCVHRFRRASMMPRHFTEEIRLDYHAGRWLSMRFNDASAFHRGNLVMSGTA